MSEGSVRKWKGKISFQFVWENIFYLNFHSYFVHSLVKFSGLGGRILFSRFVSSSCHLEWFVPWRSGNVWNFPGHKVYVLLKSLNKYTKNNESNIIYFLWYGKIWQVILDMNFMNNFNDKENISLQFECNQEPQKWRIWKFEPLSTMATSVDIFAFHIGEFLIEIF